MKRLREKQAVSEATSPKKQKSDDDTEIINRDIKQCISCEQLDVKVHKVATDKVDANLRCWAHESKNFPLVGRSIVMAAEERAADVYYHLHCYLNLQHSARASSKPPSRCAAPPQFDPIATAQIVALLEDSDSVYKLSNLRRMYCLLMEDQDHQCRENVPHASRFKEHLFRLLLEW